MDNLEDTFYGYISEELMFLARDFSYPIHPSFGVWCFIEAFRKTGAEIKVSSKIVSIKANLDLPEDNYHIKADISIRQIFKGSGIYYPSSPKTFEESISNIYDRLSHNIKNSTALDEWLILQNIEEENTKKEMYVLLSDYFERYQENMLLPMDKEKSEIKKPKLFREIIKDFPMEVMARAFYNHETSYTPKYKPKIEDLLDFDWSSVNSECCPGFNTMVALFWGRYLDGLRKEKSYELRYPLEGGQLLYIQGEHALKTSKEMKTIHLQ